MGLKNNSGLKNKNGELKPLRLGITFLSYIFLLSSKNLGGFFL